MANLLTRLLTLPFSLFTLIIGRIFRSLPYTRLRSGSSPSSNGVQDGTHIVDPTASSEYFIRMLQSHARTAGFNAFEDGDSNLWYKAGGYNAALRKAKEDVKILMVVLTSKDHDDNAAFLRQTLCTSAFISLLHDHRNTIMMWGGEVCISRDAHVASTILQAATFPFIAFLSIQPIQPSRLSGSTPSPAVSGKMSVFSRLEGIDTCSVPTLSNHITETLLPRMQPFLNRLKTQVREREMQRLLRDEQDRAYAEAGRKDMERVKAKEAELNTKKQAEQNARLAEAKRQKEKTNRDAWRRQTAANFGAEPSDKQQDAVRLVIRLPDGKRLVRRLPFKDPAETIWHLVDCEANGYSTTNPGSASAVGMDRGYEPNITFSLASTFPRRLLSLDSVQGKNIGQLLDEGQLDKQVANLVVEGYNASASSKTTLPAASGQESDDEIISEEE